MIEPIYAIGLWLIVAWPLLLAIPPLRSRVPQPLLVAVLPAVVLLLLPIDGSLSLSGVLFGSGFAIDTDIRWILAMTLSVWLALASQSLLAAAPTPRSTRTTLLLLTFAGNLGAVLSNELIGFFSFTTLMGYAFYGLMVEASDAGVDRATKRYLILLVIADLVLFEALLLASFYAVDLQFDGLRQQMPLSPVSAIYQSMVLVGFMLKLGAWPTQSWLLELSRSASPYRLTLAAVPVAMAMLGIIRWLPIGENHYPVIGLMLQLIGGAAILYTLIKIKPSFSPSCLPGWLSLVGIGLFIMALGSALAKPDLWQQYAYLSYPLIALYGTSIALLSLITGKRQDGRNFPADIPPPFVFQRWAEYGFNMIRGWAERRIQQAMQVWRISQRSGLTWITRFAVKTESLSGWSLSITLFIILLITMASLAR